MAGLVAILSWILIAGGVFFFLTGSIGLLRFPDIFTRLHAVTKTDTAGLGLLAAGLAVQAADLLVTLLLLLIWILVMGSSAISCQLLARYSLELDPIDEFSLANEQTDGSKTSSNKTGSQSTPQIKPGSGSKSRGRGDHG
jgi:multicomponent Na+:H+ antiporter subunit G